MIDLTVLAHLIRPTARLHGGGDWATPRGSSEGHTSRSDENRNAVNALEVADPGSRGFAPRRLWPGFLQCERNEAEQLCFRVA